MTILSITLTPGSPAWWAALADLCALRALAYRALGMAAESRRWQGVAADCSAALARVTR